MSRIITVYDNANTTHSYLNGTFTVSASGSTTTTTSQLFPITRDPQLIADVNANSVYLSDGSNFYYSTNDMLNFLNLTANGLGGAVVGYTGAISPSFAILVGGMDPSGNIQSGQLNSLKELIVQYRNSYRNITGNATVTVKSGAGRLHGIMINRNWTGGTVVVYDNTAGSGTVLATIDVGTPSGGLLSSSGVPGPIMIGPLGAEFSTGLTVVTSGSTSNNITVLYY